MSCVAVTIQELFESGQSPDSKTKYAIFWKTMWADLVSTRFSSIWKRQPRPSQRWGALQVARLECLSSSKTPKRRSQEILEESRENWLLLFVWAMKRCRLCLRMIWTCPSTRLPIGSVTVSRHKDQETAKSKASSWESEGWPTTSSLVDRWEVIHCLGS